MEYLGIGIFAVVLIGAGWLMSRAMTSSGRNEGSKHGGGRDDWNSDAIYGSDNTSGQD